MCEIIEHERFKNKKYEKSCTYLMKRKRKNGKMKKEMSDWTTEWNELFIRHIYWGFCENGNKNKKHWIRFMNL